MFVSWGKTMDLSRFCHNLAASLAAVTLFQQKRTRLAIGKLAMDSIIWVPPGKITKKWKDPPFSMGIDPLFLWPCSMAT